MVEKRVVQNKPITEEEKQKLLQLSEISLIIDTYEDIFSDFDPRPFTERALSDDFLLEARKASRDKEEGIQLKFLIPKELRNIEQEKRIVTRLRGHFKKHAEEKKKEFKDLIIQGISFLLLGILFMVLTTFILFRQENSSAFITFLSVLFEPAGWFLFWEGLDLIIFESKKIKPEYEFNQKLARCDLSFISY